MKSVAVTSSMIVVAVVNCCFTSLFDTNGPFKWQFNMIKTVQSIDEMNDVQMMTWGRGHRAWRVFESVFLHSPNKGFWACLGDSPPGMPMRPEITFSCSKSAPTANISACTVVTLHWQCLHWYESCIGTAVEPRNQGKPLAINQWSTSGRKTLFIYSLPHPCHFFAQHYVL